MRKEEKRCSFDPVTTVGTWDPTLPETLRSHSESSSEMRLHRTAAKCRVTSDHLSSAMGEEDASSFLGSYS